MRVAFCGASGTGKSTLAAFIAEKYNLPVNPVGSRSVSKAMGFDSPYDVDKAGKRAEFQRRLVTEKVAWEHEHESFVVDRTTLDCLAYTMLHDVHAIDQALLKAVVEGMQRYTHVFVCPFDAFCNPGDDSARVKDMTYHELYDLTLKAFLDKYRPMQTKLRVLHDSELDGRKKAVTSLLG